MNLQLVAALCALASNGKISCLKSVEACVLKAEHRRWVDLEWEQHSMTAGPDGCISFQRLRRSAFEVHQECGHKPGEAVYVPDLVDFAYPTVKLKTEGQPSQEDIDHQKCFLKWEKNS